MEATAIFDLYYLFVENVFGSVLLSGIGFVILFGFMGFASKMSPTTVIILLTFFAGVFAIGYAGELAAVFLFIFSALYFTFALSKFILRRLE